MGYTRRDVDRLLAHAHPTPVLLGIADRYVAQRFPGWSWNRLIRALRATGAVELTVTGPQRCHARVRTLQVSRAGVCAAEWADGTVTTSTHESR